MHEFSSPPAISISKKEFKSLGKTVTSKKEKKALRRVEKRKDKEAVSAVRDLVPVRDSNSVPAHQGPYWLHYCTEPHASSSSSQLISSQLISSYTAVGTNHPVILKRPAKLIIPHAARPVVSGQVETSVDGNCYDITVQEMSLREDGRGLTEWRSVRDEDVKPAEEFVTVMLRKVARFSTFVVTAMQSTKERAIGTLRNWMLKELEFCVVGSQYYNKDMIPRVVCFSNGCTPSTICNRLSSDGTVERMVVWGPPHAARVALGEDVTMKMAIRQANWAIEPEEQQMILSIFSSSYAIRSVSFLITAPFSHPCEASGLCFPESQILLRYHSVLPRPWTLVAVMLR